MKINMLGLFFLSFSSFALANQVSSGCNGNSPCMPSIHQKDNTGIYANFYCKVDPKATTVSFANHNLLVSGFNPSSGTLVFGTGGTYPVSKLNNIYFEVINDLQHDGPWKSITFSSDGNISCNDGTGGRSEILQGFGIPKQK